jgi:hypothetical protein
MVRTEILTKTTMQISSTFIQLKAKLLPEAPAPTRPAEVHCVVCPRHEEKKTTAYCYNCERLMCVKHVKYVCQICLDSESSE